MKHPKLDQYLIKSCWIRIKFNVEMQQLNAHLTKKTCNLYGYINKIRVITSISGAE